MKRLTTRSITTATAIRDREDFNTSGALRGRRVPRLSSWDSGSLTGDDLERFRNDCWLITYVVYSYSTPIAWFVGSGVGWYFVEAKFSRTTSKHQGNLYLAKTRQAEREAEREAWLASEQGKCDGLPLGQTTCPDRAGHM